MSKFSPRSTSNRPSDDGKPIIDLIQQDLRDIARILNTPAVVNLTAPDRIAIPYGGKADVYVLTNLETATSTGVNYHTISATRSGQSEGQVSIDTRNAEMSAYKLYYCGTFNVGEGDIMSYTLTVAGAPVPTLTASNLTILCRLTATETMP